MGLETTAIVAIAAAAVGTATTVYSATQQSRAAKKSASAQKEASAIAAANQKNQEMAQRRQEIRNQRIRQAQIQQGAVNAGASDSSGEFGSLSALSTNTGVSLANLSGSQLASEGIARQNQVAVDAQVQGQTWSSIGSIGSSIVGLSASTAGQGLGKLFSSTPATTPKN